LTALKDGIVQKPPNLIEPHVNLVNIMTAISASTVIPDIILQQLVLLSGIFSNAIKVTIVWRAQKSAGLTKAARIRIPGVMSVKKENPAIVQNLKMGAASVITDLTPQTKVWTVACNVQTDTIAMKEKIFTQSMKAVPKIITVLVALHRNPALVEHTTTTNTVDQTEHAANATVVPIVVKA
jgi:hypothetical protein